MRQKHVHSSAARRLARWSRSIVVVVLGCACGSQNAWAQSKEAFGEIGLARLAEDEGFIADGISFGGGVSFQFGGRWEFTINLRRYDHERPSRTGSSFFHQGHTTVLGPGVVYRFSNNRVQPFLRAGLSYGRMSGTRGFAPTDDGTGDRFEGTESFVGPDLGVGVKVSVFERMSLRAEARSFIGNSRRYTPGASLIEPPLYLSAFLAGVGYHW